MSEGIWVAIISAAGVVLAAVVGLWKRSHKGESGFPATAVKEAPSLVLGELVDIRELRILRALFAEPRGRALEIYQDAYYGPALQTVVSKGWVKKSEGRYNLTAKGLEVCRAYLRQQLEQWHPS